MIKTFLVAILLGVVSIDAHISKGTCVFTPALPSFDASQYLGTWFEVQRFNYIFEDFLKCVNATYGKLNSTFVSVANVGTNTVSGQTQSVNGYAYAPKASEPNKLIVNLPVSLNNQTYFRNNGNYNVISTDYKNYALVYSCTPILGVAKDEIVWILGRKKTLDSSIIQDLKMTLTKLSIDPTPFKVIDQSC